MQHVFDLTYTTSLVDLHLEYLRDCVRACESCVYGVCAYVRACVCQVCMVCVRTCVRACVDFVGFQNNVA